MPGESCWRPVSLGPALTVIPALCGYSRSTTDQIQSVLFRNTGAMHGVWKLFGLDFWLRDFSRDSKIGVPLWTSDMQ